MSERRHGLDVDPSQGPEAVIRQVFDQIPFVRELGLEIVSLEEERVTLRLPMRPGLVGHPIHRSLHGGVISAVLDTVGGLACFVQPLLRHPDMTLATATERFRRLGTIDLRVDYLEPGKGEYFDATATLIRRGGHVAVTEMELRDDGGRLVARGTAAFVVR